MFLYNENGIYESALIKVKEETHKKKSIYTRINFIIKQ